MGDKDKTVALYIKYRVAQLKDECSAVAQARLASEKDRAKRAEVEAKNRRAEEQQDTENLRRDLITICKKCGFVGAMKSSLFPPEGHVPFTPACKCPQCGKRFDWYYVPSVEIREKQRGQQSV